MQYYSAARFNVDAEQNQAPRVHEQHKDPTQGAFNFDSDNLENTERAYRSLRHQTL